MNKIVFFANEICEGRYDCDVDASLWEPVIRYIFENHKTLEFCKDKIHTLWTVSGGHLRKKINNDELLTKVLKLVLPLYCGEGLVLYRGECRFLYENRKIGFCWTSDIEVAKKFSIRNAHKTGRLLLKAYAPKKAIFAIAFPLNF